MGDFIGDLFEKVSTALLRSQTGRWVLTALLVLVSISGFTTYSGLPQDQAWARVGIGVFFGVLALVMLVYTWRFGRLAQQAKTSNKKADARIQELKSSGQLLPIPVLPANPKSLSAETAAAAGEYARRMASLPWGREPEIAPDQVRGVFDHAVAQVRRVRGDWSAFSPQIDTFVRMPKPLCYVGAAEIMYRLSYSHWRTYAPTGLQQGLKFIANAQYTEPQQPDALLIRVKLLAGSANTRWLELADQALVLAKQIAPQHPRLPDAEAALQVQRGQYDAALASLRAALAVAPTPEEAFVYRANIAGLLMNMQRSDEALAAYDEVLALDPRDPWTWHNKSILLENLGRYGEALEANGRALALMDFGAAQRLRQRVLAKMAEAGASNAAQE